MRINIDTLQKSCDIVFCKDDISHMENMLALRQAIALAAPDSKFAVHFEDGWDFGPLGELEALAEKIGFDIAMRHGDIEVTGPPSVAKKFVAIWNRALEGTK